MSSFLCGVLSYGLDFHKLEQEQIYVCQEEAPYVKPWQTEGEKEQARHLFVEAALTVSHDVHLWLGIMEKNGITLSKEAIWIQKAVLNDPTFSVEKLPS